MLMADTKINSQLTSLLIQIHRSLLQYVDQSWPRVPSSEEETHQTVQRLAADQRQSAAALAHLLNDLKQHVDFGTYPTAYTSLHYVRIDFLLDDLVRNQESIVKACNSSLETLSLHPMASSLVRDILVAEERRLDELRKLTAS